MLMINYVNLFAAGLFCHFPFLYNTALIQCSYNLIFHCYQIFKTIYFWYFKFMNNALSQFFSITIFLRQMFLQGDPQHKMCILQSPCRFVQRVIFLNLKKRLVVFDDRQQKKAMMYRITWKQSLEVYDLEIHCIRPIIFKIVQGKNGKYHLRFLSIHKIESVDLYATEAYNKNS